MADSGIAKLSPKLLGIAAGKAADKYKFFGNSLRNLKSKKNVDPYFISVVGSKKKKAFRQMSRFAGGMNKSGSGISKLSRELLSRAADVARKKRARIKSSRERDTFSHTNPKGMYPDSMFRSAKAEERKLAFQESLFSDRTKNMDSGLRNRRAKYAMRNASDARRKMRKGIEMSGSGIAKLSTKLIRRALHNSVYDEMRISRMREDLPNTTFRGDKKVEAFMENKQWRRGRQADKFISRLKSRGVPLRGTKPPKSHIPKGDRFRNALDGIRNFKYEGKNLRRVRG